MNRIVIALAILTALVWSFWHAGWSGHAHGLISDSWIQRQAEKRIDSNAVVIGVDDGWVSLTGRVPTESFKTQITDSVRRIPGVTGLSNGLVVLNASALARLQAMVAAPPMSVELNYQILADGVVLLRGTVPDELIKQQIEDLVRSIAGVREVDNQLVVKPRQPLAHKIESQLAEIMKISKIYFEFDKWRLLPQSTPAIESIANVLMTYPNTLVRIEGHTDSVGTDAYNQVLSERRAGAVRDALLARGVAAPRLVAQGLGEARPIADNASNEGRARNRRIEFHVVSLE